MKNKKIAVAAAVAVLAVLAAVFWQDVGIPALEFVSDTERLRAWVDGGGIRVKLIYALGMALQMIVVIIPSEPFEVAAGYAFGTVWGTAVCLVGSAVGSMITFFLVRKFGMKLVRVFFSEEQIESAGILKMGSKKTAFLAVLFIIPGSPKSLISYLAGLTDIKPFAWFLICSVGRFAAIITSTISGDILGSGKTVLAIVIYAATIVLSLAGLWLYDRIRNRKLAEVSAAETEASEK